MIVMENREKERGKNQPFRQSKGLNGKKALHAMGNRLVMALIILALVLGGCPAPLSADSTGWNPAEKNAVTTVPAPAITGQDITAAAGNPGFRTSALDVPTDGPSTAAEVDPEQKTRVEKMLAHLPLFFIQNQGQVDEQVSFYTQGQNQALYFTQQGLTFTFNETQEPVDKNSLSDPASSIKNDRDSGDSNRWAVKLYFIGSNPNVAPRGEAPAPTKISYFKGTPDTWKNNVDTYTSIIYPQLWPGIDLVFKGDNGSLKYEFVVSPGADPAQIRLVWKGAQQVLINEQDQMEVKTPLDNLTDQAPIAWQEKAGERTAVSAAYSLNTSQQDNAPWGFELGSYDPTRELIIDPAFLDYCGYIGGSGRDRAQCIAVDSSGLAYVAGETESAADTFPESGGPYLANTGDYDGFVARVSADGSSLDYCGYIGGSGYDSINSIAVDSSERAYVTGITNSTEANFPVNVGPDLTHNGGYDAFVARVAEDGTSLDYCGYIGGSADDRCAGIAVDSSDQAYIVGDTTSTEATFPVSGGLDLTHNGNADAFVARVVNDGVSIDFCGYIGGSESDQCTGIAIDSTGHIYVTGITASTEADFPVSGGPDLTYNGGDYDAFVARVADGGASLDYCGYIGGSGRDWANGIAVDSNGRTYVAGETSSTEADFPVSVGPDLTFNGGYDAFVARVADGGASLDYCGYIGGSSNDKANGIALDGNGRACVAGDTRSGEADFPVSGGPDLDYNGGTKDAFVARVAYGGVSLDYCGYIGGSSDDYGTSIAVNNAWGTYVAGITASSDFTVNGGPDLTHNLSFDAFVARVSFVSAENDILGFTLPEQTGPAAIDNAAHTVNIQVTGGTDLTSLTPTIAVSPGAAINPASGAAQDFSAPVTYTVTADNGDPQTWTVTVTAGLSAENDILGFTLPQQTGPATIDNAAHTVNIQVASGTDLTSLTPTITVSPGATINPASGAAQDFSIPVTYTVTADNGDPQTWTMAVAAAPPAGGGGGGGGSLSGDTVFLVTPSGRIISQDGITITFPAGAVESDINITIKQATQSSGLNIPEGSQLLSRIINIAKNISGNFLKPVTISLSFDQSAINPDEYDIALCYYDEATGKWVALDNISIELAAGETRGDTTHFTKFAVIATPKIEKTPETETPPSDKNILDDISGHWAKDSIMQLINAGIICGYPDGSFKPDRIITRAEFTVMAVQALQLETNVGITFSDTASHWARDIISTAAAHGIISGYEDERFGPDDPITREQAALIVARAAKLEAAAGGLNFSDSQAISPWAKPDVAAAVKSGFIGGYPDNSFKPQGKTTRAEAAAMIVKLL